MFSSLPSLSPGRVFVVFRADLEQLTFESASAKGLFARGILNALMLSSLELCYCRKCRSALLGERRDRVVNNDVDRLIYGLHSRVSNFLAR